MKEKIAAETLNIRATSIEDAAAICSMANMPLYRLGTLRQPFQRVEDTAKWLGSLSASSVSIVAEYEGEIIGHAGLERLGGRRLQAASLGMGVADHFQGRGVGSALLAALIDAADNWLNIRRIELTVYTDNEAAIGLYEKHGFIREGLLRDYGFRNGAFADVFAMARIQAR